VYYLMLAEGGTGWNHGISMARARSLLGPYEVDPAGSVMTSRNDESLALQKAGHGELVQTPAGDWYMAHLCSRPLGKAESRRCMLGRETSLQKVVWSQDGWVRLPDGTTRPAIEVMAPTESPEKVWPLLAERDDFDCLTLGPQWNSLRVPVSDSWLTFRERPGWLRLRGRESLLSLFDQSLIAQRLQSFHVVAETCLEFKPETFNQMAGLICWYDTRTHYYLRVTHHDVLGTILGIILTDDGAYDEMPDSQVVINGWDRCYLRAEIDYGWLQFSASRDGSEWQLVGVPLDATKLSDDYGKNILHFTGAFIGICAQDMSGSRLHADFDYFEMRDLDQS
jgi:xylan 1,4-beta-xylosidase